MTAMAAREVAHVSNGIENVTGDLTPAESRHLLMLERRIERGLQTFREVGEALVEIRDKRLFRMSHPTFEAYVGERWQLARARAYQLMGAAEVAKVLGPSGGDLVNEAQARELVPLLHTDPKLVPKAWEEIKATGQPITAPSIRKVAARVVGAPPPPEPSLTERLVVRLSGTANDYAIWQKSKPNRAEKAKVSEAFERLCSLAGR